MSLCCCGREADVSRFWRVEARPPTLAYTSAHHICYQCVLTKSPLLIQDNRKPDFIYINDHYSRFSSKPHFLREDIKKARF